MEDGDRSRSCELLLRLECQVVWSVGNHFPEPKPFLTPQSKMYTTGDLAHQPETAIAYNAVIAPILERRHGPVLRDNNRERVGHFHDE